MARSPISRGQCTYCGHVAAKHTISKHLQSCAVRKERKEQAAASGRAAETLHHIRVQNRYDKDFWLDLEVRGSATLKQIDSYLRDIWLECCGHLSEFQANERYGKAVGMARKVDSVFTPGTTILHIYDFGTSSETLLTSVEQSTDVPLSKHPLSLMARNLMPQVQCMECDKPATHLCMECQIEEDESGMLCDEHVAEHPHDNYGEPFPLVNSPRLGLCGYEGPAEPPYV